MDNKITKSIVFKFMREALKTSAEYNDCGRLMTNTIIKMVGAQLLSLPPGQSFNDFYSVEFNYKSPLAVLLTECYTNLFLRGIIIGSPDLYKHGDLTNFCITEYGKEWIKSEADPIPEDKEGYINHLKKTIPNIDEVIIQYVSEALRTFDTECFFASAVMLGAAAEKSLYLFADCICNSMQDPKQKIDILRNINARGLMKLITQVSNILSPDNLKKKKIPYKVHEESSSSLMALFNAIRIQRNDAVHPVIAIISKSELRLLLMSFPHVCSKVYDFINWLKENKI